MARKLKATVECGDHTAITVSEQNRIASCGTGTQDVVDISVNPGWGVVITTRAQGEKLISLMRRAIESTFD